MVDINKSLLRGKSIDGWTCVGKGAWFHVYYSSINVVKDIIDKVCGQKVEFLPISQNDIEKAYRCLINYFGVEHYCSKEEYINDLTDKMIYRCSHPAYKEIERIILYNPHWKENEIVSFLSLEPFNGGYIKYLNGLCALEMFDNLPTIKDCTKKLDGQAKEPFLFKYLVCFEGEEVGEDIGDWGETWKLFKPSRILWIEESGFNDKRIIFN